MQQLPPPTCIDSFRLGFQNYCNFNGRARRSEYFYFFLTVWVINTILLYAVFIEAGNSSNEENMMIFLFAWLVFCFITMIPSLSLTVRRLHDTGRSGWYVLVLLLNIIGVCILLIFVCEDSEKITNEYGPSPKYVQPPGAVITQPAYVPPPVVVTPVVVPPPVVTPVVSIPVVQPIGQPPYPQVVPNQALPLQPYEGYNSADIVGQ